MIALTRYLTSGLISLLLGIALTLSFAPYYLFPLAIIAPAGLIALLLKRSREQSFWYGYLFGIGSFSTGVYWIFTSIHVIGGVPTALSFLLTAGFIATLSFYPALTAFVTKRYFPHTTDFLCLFPILWTLSEWFRTFLFSGFPWLFIGYSQTLSPLKGYAPLLGVYGITFIVLITSSASVYAYLTYRTKHYRSLYFSLLFIACLWIGGGLLSLIHWTKPQGKPLSVALIQGNIPQSLKWSPEHLQLSIDRYESLTKPLWGKVDLIIWPEAAIPIPLQNIQDLINGWDKKAAESHTNLMLGIPIQNHEQSGYYNAIITLGESNEVYSKRLLVPFGEYVPFSNLFANTLSFLHIPPPDMVPGSPSQPLLHSNGISILASICYEVGFPLLTFSKDPQLGMILTLTNDAWFGHSSAEAQHLQMAAMRAMELGRPLLFVGNDGITASITPDGQIEKAAPQYETAVLKTTIQPVIGTTPWMLRPMDPLALICIALFLWVRRRSHIRQQALKTITPDNLVTPLKNPI